MIEILQIAIVYGRLDLRTALTLKSCCKELRDFATDNLLENVISREDPIVRVATLLDEPTHFKSLIKMMQRLRRGDVDTAKLVPKVLFDQTIQHHIADMCFDFDKYCDTQDASRSVVDFAMHIFFKAFVDHFKSGGRDLNMKRIAYAFYAKVFSRALIWVIKNHGNSVDRQRFPILTHTTLMSTIQINMTKSKDRMADMMDLGGSVRLVKAWIHSLHTGNKIALGKYGGIYTVRPFSHKRRYW